MATTDEHPARTTALLAVTLLLADQLPDAHSLLKSAIENERICAHCLMHAVVDAAADQLTGAPS